MKVKPMGMLLMKLAGWVNRHQQDVITYLKDENKIVREKLGTKRILIRNSRSVPRRQPLLDLPLEPLGVLPYQL